ncbi:C69 family dipeptidase [Haloferax sp. DFSO52]|uniref:C69 family dipeptidase n=1 Tax=Haloferax sp. DFSO52 TaxID=3388505 RepID=UPI003A85B558
MSHRTIPYSCDNAVALGDVTAAGHVVFGKNSDRPVRETQPLVFNPRETHDDGDTLELAYREIPQVEETYATLGTAPYWCWGYELGVNEHDVVAGNEAVFTEPLKDALDAHDAGDTPERGLLGMELLRLGLERATTAEAAVEVVAELLERYGQFGSAVAGKTDADGAYDNSYLVADPGEAWILETAGSSWTATRVNSGTASISNELTIREQWDRDSGEIRASAVEAGWWPGGREPFDFAEAYTDHETPLQVSHIRYQRSQQLLARYAESGTFDDTDMRRILRDHYEGTFLDGPKFNAALPDFLTICMHDSPAEFTWGDTVSSAVFELPADDDGFTTMWWTPGPPCIGAYVPVYILSGGVPDVVSHGGTVGRTLAQPATVAADEFAADSYWWQFKRLLDAAKGDDHGSQFEQNRRLVRKRFDRLESQFREEAERNEAEARTLVRAGNQDEASRLLASFTAECVEAVLETVDDLVETIHEAE